MSKAFTRETATETNDGDDDAPGLPPLPPGGKNYITPAGYARLRAELKELIEVERPKVVDVVHWAASNGDRSENGDYHYGKKRLREIDRRIRFLIKRLEIAVVADPMQVLNDPAAMRGFLLTYSEKVIALESKVAEQAPKIEALARLSESDGSLLLTDAAKTLGIQPKQFIQSLSSKRWIYKRTGSNHWVAYQDKLQSGYLEHKVKTVQRKDGSDKITEQVRVTPKGLTKLAAIFSSTGAK